MLGWAGNKPTVCGDRPAHTVQTPSLYTLSKAEMFENQLCTAETLVHFNHNRHLCFTVCYPLVEPQHALNGINSTEVEENQEGISRVDQTMDTMVFLRTVTLTVPSQTTTLVPMQQSLLFFDSACTVWYEIKYWLKKAVTHPVQYIQFTIKIKNKKRQIKCGMMYGVDNALEGQSNRIRGHG